MNPLLLQAIREKRRLRFVDHDKPRLAEPQCYGRGHKDNDLLRVHQLQGGAEREPLFTVAKITRLELLDTHFEQPGPNYKRGDSAMKVIYAQL